MLDRRGVHTLLPLAYRCTAGWQRQWNFPTQGHLRSTLSCLSAPLPAADLNLLFLGFNPIGGTLPASLRVPSTLNYLLMESTNLTGPLPPWPLPSVQSVRAVVAGL